MIHVKCLAQCLRHSKFSNVKERKSKCKYTERKRATRSSISFLYSPRVQSVKKTREGGEAKCKENPSHVLLLEENEGKEEQHKPSVRATRKWV